MVAPIPRQNSTQLLQHLMRRYFPSCCSCCLSPSTTYTRAEPPPTTVRRKASERIYFDLENIQFVPTAALPSSVYEEEVPEQIVEAINIRVSSEPEHFIFDQRRRAPPKKPTAAEDPAESYGPSTSNWTETDSSAETSSPVFAPSWKRNRLKFFQTQRRHYRTQHPRRIYAAAGATTTSSTSKRPRGLPISANSTSTNSLSSTPGPLKRFSCRRDLFSRPMEFSAAEMESARQPADGSRRGMMDLHLKTTTTVTPPPFPQQQPPRPLAAAIRPLHRTLSAHLSKSRLKLPPLNEEGVLETNGGGAIQLSPTSNIADLVSSPEAPLNPNIPSTSQSVNVHNLLIGFRRRISHLSLTSNFSSDASFYLLGHRRRPFEDSTIYTTETDARIYSDDESRLSTSTDNITSVSRQHYNLYRKRRRQFPRSRRQPSRASSLSSMTETSMALEVITVTLNMDTVNFLGISIVGQSSSRGDNGIYVANVMPGGAVALDGRIEPGDMILQVNDISFENFKNDQAVEVLKQAVSKRGPIKLTVAKSFDAGRANYFSVPVREPVRPIDTHAWVQHTNAVRGVAPGCAGGGGTLISAMNAIPEGSEGAPTPIPGQYPPQTHHQGSGAAMMNAFMSMGGQQQQQRPATSSSTTATSNGSGGAAPQTIIGPGGVFLAMQPRLDVHTDRRKVVHAMAAPNSGLDIRDRTWLKIPIPMSFLGRSLVDWLLENVDGIGDRKEARRYAGDLLKERLIAHVVNKQQFTEQCYYIFGEQCADFLTLRHASQNGAGSIAPHQQQIEMTAQGMSMFTNQPQIASYIQQQTTNIGSSEYASMPPVSPYPGPNMATTMQQMDYQNHQQQKPPQQRQTKFNQQIYGAGLNPMQRGVVGGGGTTGIPEQFGTTSQASNNSNEESSGSEQRRKAILPLAPSLTSVGPSNTTTTFQHHHPHQQQQFNRPHYAGQNLTGATAAIARPPPIGAPPSTPIGDEAVAPNSSRIAGGGGQQQQAQGRIRLAENFPEVFLEHF